MAADHADVIFTPAEFAALAPRDLSQTQCVVIDVLRATSSMAIALAHGASAIIPVEEIEEAVALRRADPRILLAGERDGLRIEAEATGDAAFDFGNSPREFTRERVNGKTIAMTTTNGTRALRACAHAQSVIVASFLNLSATMKYLRTDHSARLLFVCGGTFAEAAYEDVLCAGAMLDLLADGVETMSDAALIARKVYRAERDDLPGALARSRNGRRLLERPELSPDVAFCATPDLANVAAGLGQDRRVTVLDSNR